MNFLVRMVTALSAMAEAALKRMEALELEEGDGEEELCYRLLKKCNEGGRALKCSKHKF